ncbi:MAG: hypothetical protein U0703_08245 [Anaerolineae bacterium]
MTELEAGELMRLNRSAAFDPRFLASGQRAFLGMASPSLNRIQQGDPFTACCAPWGGLTSRAGFVVENAGQLPADIQDYVDQVVALHQAIVAWYEHIGIGVTGGDLYRIIHDRIGDPFYGVRLNPGHLIHLDEWVHSPVYEGSTEQLQSGMALPGGRDPGDRDELLHLEYRGWDRAGGRSAAGGVRRAVSRSVGTDSGAAGVHAGRAGHYAQAGGAALLEYPGVPAAVRAVAAPGDALSVGAPYPAMTWQSVSDLTSLNPILCSPLYAVERGDGVRSVCWLF